MEAKMKMKISGAFVCVAALLVGCGGSSDLELAFVSGHLGDYRACPTQAAVANKDAEANKAAKAQPPTNFKDREGCSFCECYSSHPSCKDPKQPAGCIDPMITFDVTNRADASVAIPSVASVRLLVDGAEPTSLRLLKVVIGDASLEQLASGAALRMQASFQGLAAVDWASHPRVELAIDSADTAPALMTTPDLRPFGQ
jgi:hypothetical protein